MVLPFTGSWYDEVITFPKAFGIYSFSVLMNTSITLYVMKSYAKGFILRAYKNYAEYKSTNMETLIALGSISAFFLFLFFLFRYTLESINNQLEVSMIPMAIMDINDALTSASIIVLVVTVGKYF